MLLGTDSEFHSVDKSWVSTSFSTTDKNWMFVRPDIQSKVQVQDWCDRNGVILQFIEMTDDTCLLNLLNLPDNHIELLMYYSPKDLEYAIGWNNVKAAYLDGVLEQKRNIHNRKDWKVGKYSIKVKDLIGWAGPQKLVNFAAGVGVTMGAKGDMEQYKSHMLDGINLEPAKYCEYSTADARDLLSIYDAFIKLVSWVHTDIINMPTFDNLPMTTGSLVSKTLENWIMALDPSVRLAILKLGILDTSDFKHKENIRKFQAVLNGEHEKLLEMKFRFNGISQAGCSYFMGVTQDSSAFNALVQGGRCVNERPSEYVVKGPGADIDLNSCYGTSLSLFTYPVGLPTVWGFTPNQMRMTLRTWLKNYESDLVDNLWTCTVSGKLSFRQDLIFSKIVTQKQINKGPEDKDFNDPNRDDDNPHIPGVFALIRSEIEHGIITSDILKALRAVCSNLELKEILDLEIDSAAAYLKSNRIQDITEWTSVVLSDKGTFHTTGGLHNSLLDTRTRAWYGVELENFIGKLVSTRNELKKSKATAKQTVLKLFINTTYGVLASPYFDVGNTIVANNITGRARLGAWMLAKALHTRQSITDGGMYSLVEVPYFSGYKPSMNALVDQTTWVSKGKGYCRGIDTLPGYTEGCNLDAVATAHINNFWAPYNIQLPFEIEHKLSNNFTKASYISKAHYKLEATVGDPVYKVRGARRYNCNLNEDVVYTCHPTYELLDNMCAGSDDFPENMNYDHKYLLKIGRWVESQVSKGWADLKELRPGDNVVEQRTARYNNTHIPADTVAEYMKRANRKTHESGTPVEFFEKYRELGISAVHRKMLVDRR